MCINIQRFVEGNETFRRISQQKLLNAAKGTDLGNDVKIVINKFSNDIYIFQFSFGGMEFYSESMHKNTKKEIVNLFNNRGNKSILDFLKEIAGKFTIFQVFGVANKTVTSKKKISTTVFSGLIDWFKMIIAGIAAPATTATAAASATPSTSTLTPGSTQRARPTPRLQQSTPKNRNSQTQAATTQATSQEEGFIQWSARQCRERPLVTTLAVAGGVAVGAGAAYLTYQAIKGNEPVQSSDSESETLSASDNHLPPAPGVDPDDLTDQSDLSSSEAEISSDEGGASSKTFSGPSAHADKEPEERSVSSMNENESKSEDDTKGLAGITVSSPSPERVAIDEESDSEVISMPSVIADSSSDEEPEERSSSSVSESESESEDDTIKPPSLTAKSSRLTRAVVAEMGKEAGARLNAETSARQVGRHTFFEYFCIAKTVAELGGDKKVQCAVQNFMKGPGRM